LLIQYLLETIATESRHALAQTFPPLSAYVEAAAPVATAEPAHSSTAAGPG
jgi:hypothetical protein